MPMRPRSVKRLVKNSHAVNRASKRETAKAMLVRLAADLADLAARSEAAFAEARANNFELTAAEGALLDQRTVLITAAIDLDRFCDDAQDLRGAPPAEFDNIPKRQTGNVSPLLKAVQQRVVWLESLARYRVEQP